MEYNSPTHDLLSTFAHTAFHDKLQRHKSTIASRSIRKKSQVTYRTSRYFRNLRNVLQRVEFTRRTSRASFHTGSKGCLQRAPTIVRLRKKIDDKDYERQDTINLVLTSSNSARIERDLSRVCSLKDKSEKVSELYVCRPQRTSPLSSGSRFGIGEHIPYLSIRRIFVPAPVQPRHSLFKHKPEDVGCATTSSGAAVFAGKGSKFPTTSLVTVVTV